MAFGLGTRNSVGISTRQCCNLPMFSLVYPAFMGSHLWRVSGDVFSSGFTVIAQFGRWTGQPCCRLKRNFSARTKTPMSFALATGACHLKKFMPMSKSRLQWVWGVTMPTSIRWLSSRWSSRAKSAWGFDGRCTPSGRRAGWLRPGM